MPCLVQEAASGDHVVVLKVRVPGRTSHVIIAAAAHAPRAHVRGAAGLLPTGAAREHWGARLPAGTTRRREREAALEGAEVLAITEGEVLFRQNDKRSVIRVQAGRVVVSDASDGPDARVSGAPDLEALLHDDVARTELEQRGLALVLALAEAGLAQHRSDVAKALDAGAKRLARRREAVAADLSRIGDADRIASQAQWLVAEATRAKRGATELVVTDWSTGEAVQRVIPLDPAKSAREQVEAMFKRAKRLRLGARVAEQRLAQTDLQLAAVREAAARVREAVTLPDIDARAAEAKRAAPREVVLRSPGASGASGAQRRRPEERVPFRTFVGASGTKILVGKGAADNDALTTKVARPHDLWVHAKEHTGAHVIVVLPKGHTCAAGDLVDAAHLAAHFSDVKGEKVVDVQYAPRRHVRKPKGSSPGLVVVDREKVLVLRVEPERLRALLEREEVA
jgi:hypothetical protein